MPTTKPRTIVTFPTPESLETLRQKAAKLEISLNSYILRCCKVKELKRGALKGNKRNPHGRKGKREEI
jgi:hypothetical protein